MLCEENVVNFKEAQCLQAKRPRTDEQLVNELAALQARLRMLDELNSRLCQESNDARAALRGELGEEVEVAMLCHPGAQSFALAAYPKHL